MRLRWSYDGACLDCPCCRFTSLLVAYCILVHQAWPSFRSRQSLKVGCVPMYDSIMNISDNDKTSRNHRNQ